MCMFYKSLPFEMSLGETSYICKSLLKDDTSMLMIVVMVILTIIM